MRFARDPCTIRLLPDLVSGRIERKIVIEPWRAFTLSVNRDFVAEASAFDEIVQAAGFVFPNSDGALDTNLILVPTTRANVIFEAATCIVYAVCVASGKNALALLFDSVKLTHLHPLPQHPLQRYSRARSTVDQVNAEGLGICTHTLDREDVCHTGTSVGFVSKLNVDTYRAVPKEA